MFGVVNKQGMVLGRCPGAVTLEQAASRVRASLERAGHTAGVQFPHGWSVARIDVQPKGRSFTQKLYVKEIA